MQSEIANSRACDNDLDARVRDFLEDLKDPVLATCDRGRTMPTTYAFQMLLLSCGEIEHLLLIVNENSSFRFRLCDIQAASEDCNLRLVDSLYHT